MCRIAICDDDPDFVGQLKEYILQYHRENDKKVFIKVYADSDELMEAVERRMLYDLYILDIMMPEYTGMDLLDVLKRNEIETEVILLTSYTEYAVEACSYKNVFRYIPKEVSFRKLADALDAFYLEKEKKRKQRPYVIQNRTKCVKFYQEDIAFLYRDRKYVIFVMAGGKKERERGSLSEIHKKLQNPDMVMLDRSYIVNISHINRIYLDEVTMDTKDIIRTNRNHVQKLKEAFAVYWGERI